MDEMPSLKNCHEFALPDLGDARGGLVAIEGTRTVPFAIRRVYYIYKTASGAARGGHAHKRLQQALIAVAGECKIRVSNGTVEKTVRLHRPEAALFIGQGLWREMFDFSPDCVLLVLADNFYDESEYIRDYAEYLAMVTA